MPSRQDQQELTWYEEHGDTSCRWASACFTEGSDGVSVTSLSSACIEVSYMRFESRMLCASNTQEYDPVTSREA